MMRNKNICLVVILGLELFYFSPVFAGDKFSGAGGMFSTQEMKSSIKPGGSFTSHAITDANTVTQSNQKGYSAGPVISSGVAGSNVVNNPISQAGQAVVKTTNINGAAYDPASTASEADSAKADLFLPLDSSVPASSQTETPAAPDSLTLFRGDNSGQTGNTTSTVSFSRHVSSTGVNFNPKNKSVSKGRKDLEAPLNITQQ
jgi:hypothetical protein